MIQTNVGLGFEQDNVLPFHGVWSDVNGKAIKQKSEILEKEA